MPAVTVARGRFGSASAVFLVGGVNLLAEKVKEWSVKFVSPLEEITGGGDANELWVGTGVKRAEVTQGGAFFDTTAGQAHEVLTAAGALVTSNVECIGFAGNTVGQPFVGVEGSFQHEYEVLGVIKQLTRANVTHVVSGVMEQGEIIHELSAEVDGSSTETGSVDGLAQTVSGGTAYLQITALALGGYTDVVITVRDSTDDSAFLDLVAMTAATVIGAERKVIAGTVEQYVASSVAFGGAGSSESVTFFLGFVRNADP